MSISSSSKFSLFYRPTSWGIDSASLVYMTVTTAENKVPRRRPVGRRGSAMSVRAGRKQTSVAMNFASYYMELCKQHRRRPLPVICVTLPHGLDFTTDRVKMDDWAPILNSLSLDRSLKSISVRSRYQCRKPLEEVNSEDKARAMVKAPVVLTRFLLEWLSQSVAQCVRNSPSLTHLELEGIPFPPDCLAVLCVGLAGTQTLQHLSLKRCYIADNGCELICRTIVDVQSIRSLNLSQCDLTSRSGTALASALSRQKLSLYHDTWKQSLRYREPNLESMPGLRRLTLNGNPHLGDTAVTDVIEAIRDSLWIKALDLQQCGLTNAIGNELLALLDHNATLVVLDVRLNSSLNDLLVREVHRRLEVNDSNCKSEYRWLTLMQKEQRTVPGVARRKNSNGDNSKVPIESNNLLAGYAKRPCQAVGQRKTISTSVSANRTKVRTPLPSSHLQRKEGTASELLGNNSKRPRTAIRLDLQAQIGSAVELYDGMILDDQDRDNDGIQRNNFDRQTLGGRKTLMREAEAKITSLAESMSTQESAKDTISAQEILRQLVDSKVEQDHLLEEIQKKDILLAEERTRRKAEEVKLRTLTSDLIELENALKTKERETEGFLLISRRSLDDICVAFDRLLGMLDSVTRNPGAGNVAYEDLLVKDGIKRHVASLIRKTKSENLRRGYLADGTEMQTPRYFSNVENKFAKSESDVRKTLPLQSPVHFERKIGDNPGVISATTLEKIRRHQPVEPADRARAIFSKIINSGAMLNFNSHVG